MVVVGSEWVMCYQYMVAAAVFNLICLALFRSARRDIRYVIFAVVCTFRAILPRMDAERVCYYDVGFISSPFVGRVCATFAECCFGYVIGDLLWALTPRSATANTDQKTSKQHPPQKKRRAVATIAVPVMTAVAQVFCWYGVATQNQFWNMFEESLWALASFTTVVYGVLVLPKDKGTVIFLLGAGVYCAYLVIVDVPMYYRRWKYDYQGITYLTLSAGVQDMMRCHKTTTDAAYWVEDFTWMGPYFSFGVFAVLWAVVRIRKQSKKH